MTSDIKAVVLGRIEQAVENRLRDQFGFLDPSKLELPPGLQGMASSEFVDALAVPLARIAGAMLRGELSLSTVERTLTEAAQLNQIDAAAALRANPYSGQVSVRTTGRISDVALAEQIRTLAERAKVQVAVQKGEKNTLTVTAGGKDFIAILEFFETLSSHYRPPSASRDERAGPVLWVSNSQMSVPCEKITLATQGSSASLSTAILQLMNEQGLVGKVTDDSRRPRWSETGHVWLSVAGADTAQLTAFQGALLDLVKREGASLRQTDYHGSEAEKTLFVSPIAIEVPKASAMDAVMHAALKFLQEAGLSATHMHTCGAIPSMNIHATVYLDAPTDDPTLLARIRDGLADILKGAGGGILTVKGSKSEVEAASAHRPEAASLTRIKAILDILGHGDPEAELSITGRKVDGRDEVWLTMFGNLRTGTSNRIRISGPTDGSLIMQVDYEGNPPRGTKAGLLDAHGIPASEVAAVCDYIRRETEEDQVAPDGRRYVDVAEARRLADTWHPPHQGS